MFSFVFLSLKKISFPCLNRSKTLQQIYDYFWLSWPPKGDGQPNFNWAYIGPKCYAVWGVSYPVSNHHQENTNNKGSGGGKEAITLVHRTHTHWQACIIILYGSILGRETEWFNVYTFLEDNPLTQSGTQACYS